MRYEVKTKNGYDFFECSSAFQKCVRRGLEADAIFWAVELDISNFHEYLWKRMKIITSEDIGFANPTIPVLIASLYKNYMDLLKKKDTTNFPERLFLIHAVIALCRSPKSRLIDWLTVENYICHDQKFRPIPDFALDKHTRKGKALKRSWKHFFDEGILLENHQLQDGEHEALEAAKSALLGECGNGLFD
jgi:replication-associated recombination protein RarA